MAALMTSVQFKSVVEPILNDPFDSLYQTRKDEYKEVFKEIQAPHKRAYYEEPVMSGFGAAPELPEGTPYDYTSGQVFYIARVVYRTYGSAYAMSEELVDDGDHISMGTIFSEHLARALIETKETLHANIPNRAFNGSYVGGDGKSLCASDHPLVTGGTWSNLLSSAAVFSQTSVEALVQQIWNAVDHNGKRIRLTPRKLVVPNALGMQAEVLLDTPQRTGTANNDSNPLKGAFPERYSRLSRLTSSTNWFILTDAPRGLMNVVRKKMVRGMEGSFETRSMRYAAHERYQPFWVDPRALYGSQAL